MSANHAAFGPPASNLRLTRSSGDSLLKARWSTEGRLTRARDSAPSALAHDAGHALARGAHHARAQPHERLGRAVDAPNLVPELGYRDGKLLVAQGVRARRARLPGVIALARRLQRRAHLRHRPARLVEGYELCWVASSQM